MIVHPTHMLAMSVSALLAYEFIVHKMTFPKLSRQSMSDFPSPLKSAIPATIDVVGTLPMESACYHLPRTDSRRAALIEERHGAFRIAIEDGVTPCEASPKEEKSDVES